MLGSTCCGPSSATVARGAGEPPEVLLRAGNAGLNTTADHLVVIREACAGPYFGPQGASGARCWCALTAPVQPSGGELPARPGHVVLVGFALSSHTPDPPVAPSVARNRSFRQIVSSARVTACSAAATNDRPSGKRAHSDVWLKNTRRGRTTTRSILTSPIASKTIHHELATDKTGHRQTRANALGATTHQHYATNLSSQHARY
jgi:hypothetical protein